MVEEKIKNLQAILIQIRRDIITEKEELDEFARFSGIPVENFKVINVFTDSLSPASILDAADVVFIGGSSDASVLEPEKYTFVPAARQLVNYCIENDIPTFASCFGFQLAVQALGGSVIKDKENMEMGTYPINLTDEAKKDLLFHDTPDNFMAISGHQERADILPDGVVLLAYTERCPFHAFKVPGKPFYAFQFHPEVNNVDLIQRLTRYQELYLDNDGELQDVIEHAIAVPESNYLVKKFIHRVVLGNHE